MISCAILERPGKWRLLVLSAGLLVAFAPLPALFWTLDVEPSFREEPSSGMTTLRELIKFNP